jgi:hypothetical protein
MPRAIWDSTILSASWPKIGRKRMQRSIARHRSATGMRTRARGLPNFSRARSSSRGEVVRVRIEENRMNRES